MNCQRVHWVNGEWVEVNPAETKQSGMVGIPVEPSSPICHYGTGNRKLQVCAGLFLTKGLFTLFGLAALSSDPQNQAFGRFMGKAAQVTGDIYDTVCQCKG